MGFSSGHDGLAVEVTVVGVASSPDTEEMLRAAETIPYHHVVTSLMDAEDEEHLAESGYWYAGRAQAYVCIDTVCLAPVDDPAALHPTVSGFLETRSGEGQDIIRSI